MTAYLWSQLFEGCSEISYTVLMLLLALGYTVTRSVLTASQVRWIIVFVFITSFFQLSLVGYQVAAFDPGLVLYVYESPPGYFLIVLKLIAWFVFVARCFKTIRKLHVKLHFYSSLLFLGSLWFLFHPFMVCIYIKVVLFKLLIIFVSCIILCKNKISPNFIGIDQYCIRGCMGERKHRQRKFSAHCLLGSHNIFICNSTICEQ